MLALQPKAVNWITSDLEINDGVTTDSYNGTAQFSDIATIMDAVVAWADATFAHTFSWTWARNSADGGAKITLAATGTFTLEATNADAQTGYGLSAGLKGSASSHEFDSSAAASWAPLSGMMARADTRVMAGGDMTADGAIRPGAPGIAGRRPVVTAVDSALGAGRLAAVLAAAHSPRRATCWQAHTSSWITFALGEVARSPDGVKHYRFDLAAAGDVI